MEQALFDPTHFVVQAARLVVCQCGCRPARTRHGPAAVLDGFLRAVNAHARRVLLINPPGVPDQTADEIALIGLLWAAQNYQDMELDARACWLVREDGIAAVTSAAQEVSAMLEGEGIRLAPPVM